MAKTILILDPPGPELHRLVQNFKRCFADGCNVELLSTAPDLLSRLQESRPADLIVLDHDHGDGRAKALTIVAEIRAIDEDIPVVVVAKKGSVRTARRAISAGATDLLVRGEQLAERVATLIGKVSKLSLLIDKNRALATENERMLAAENERFAIVGQSRQNQELIDTIQRVAQIPRPVLIVGERGTGKELIARAIHLESDEPEKPFVVVNCASFSETLLESELFGHEKGAFTGANHTTIGKFEQANQGVLFLDEIGNMPIAFQQKILRVVEYGAFTRVGGNDEVQIDVRIIAATNADLEQLMNEGRFLRDLYDRLSFEVISVTPLRERPVDIEALAEHFLSQFMREVPQLSGKKLAQSTMSFLREYSFPGNVRELKNIIERAAYRDVTNEITPEDIGLLQSEELSSGGTFDARVDAFKTKVILAALKEAAGNRAEASRNLGLEYHRFRYLMRKYGQG